MVHTPLNVVVTGCVTHPDFTCVHRSLTNSYRIVPLAEVEQQLAAEVDLLVVLVDRVAALNPRKVQAWIDANPLVPVMVVLSSLCEGALLRGNPWSGTIPVYWHKWPYCFAKFCWQRSHENVTEWQQPQTALAGDPRLAGLRMIFDPVTHNVIVSCRDKISFAGYADLLSELTPNVIWFEATKKKRNAIPNEAMNAPHALLIDADGWDENLAPRLRAFHNDFPLAPKILVVGIFRSDLESRTTPFGVNQILSKPLIDGELTWALNISLADYSSA